MAEAACELFLERGYEATSVADITQRAGLSRSSFFNYFASKSDVIWAGLDSRIAAAVDALGLIAMDADGTAAEHVLRELVEGFVPDALALALANTAAMGLEEELPREMAVRQARLARSLSELARRSGIDELSAELLGALWSAAVIASIREWAAGAGAARSALPDILQRALAATRSLPWDR